MYPVYTENVMNY